MAYCQHFPNIRHVINFYLLIAIVCLYWMYKCHIIFICIPVYSFLKLILISNLPVEPYVIHTRVT